MFQIVFLSFIETETQINLSNGYQSMGKELEVLVEPYIFVVVDC
jgi:hypothetical protein